LCASKLQDVRNVVANDPSAKGERPPAEVWINGYNSGIMLEAETLPLVLDTIATTIPSVRLSVKRQTTTTTTRNHDPKKDDVDDNVNGGGRNGTKTTTTATPRDRDGDDEDDVGNAAIQERSHDGCCDIVRIERQFWGQVRGQEVYEHILDCLYALEDPQLVDEHTVIGTTTVPDWIMGGDLTSRLWVREDPHSGNILFLRPLYKDDITTTDRRYELQTGRDDAKIRTVRHELERIRYLASLPDPYPDLLSPIEGEDAKEGTFVVTPAPPREGRHRRRNGRRTLGI
jgi:hypothetical protein